MTKMVQQEEEVEQQQKPVEIRRTKAELAFQKQREKMVNIIIDVYSDRFITENMSKYNIFSYSKPKE